MKYVMVVILAVLLSGCGKNIPASSMMEVVKFEKICLEGVQYWMGTAAPGIDKGYGYLAIQLTPEGKVIPCNQRIPTQD